MSARCGTCHAARQLPSNPAERRNCIDCHMPLQESKVITFRIGRHALAQQYRTHRIAVYDVAAADSRREAASGRECSSRDIAAEAGIYLPPRERRVAREAHVRDVRLRRGRHRFRQRRLARPVLRQRRRPGARQADRPATRCIAIWATENSRMSLRRAGVAGNGMFATGVTVGDYDNDGFLDIYVTGLRRQSALSQQRRRHVHRRDGEGGSRRRRLEQQRGLGGLRSRRLPGSVRGRYVDYDIQQAAVLRLQEAGLPHVLRPAAVRRDAGAAVPQQSGRHVHRGLAKRPAWRIRRGKVSAWRSAISMATAGPTSSWPTMASAIFCTATKATARSTTLPTAPASVST